MSRNVEFGLMRGTLSDLINELPRIIGEIRMEKRL
jgi:hypothetical protein